MSELDQLRGELQTLSARCERAERRADDAEQAVAAFARGEVDAVTLEASTTPILLHAAQRDLRDSRQMLQAVFNAAMDPMVLTDLQGRFVEANPAACDLYGLERAALIGRTLPELTGIPIEDDPDCRAVRARGHVRAEFDLAKPGGPRRLESGTVFDVAPGLDFTVMRDTTDRSAAEEALRRSEAHLRESRDRLEEAQSIAHVGSWTSGLGPEDAIQWSSECYRIFGIESDVAITVASFYEAIHPDDRERVRESSRRALEIGTPTDVEHGVQRPDGTVRRVHERGRVERDACGAPTQLVGTVQDITERHAAVEALQASEERYRRIVEGMSEGVWMYDARGVTIFMSPRMADMLGYTVEEAIGQPVFTFMHEAERGEAQRRIERRLLGADERGDFRLRQKDGADLWAVMHASALLDAEGRFEAGLVLVTDVTTQRRGDETRSRLSAIVESSDDGMFSRDLDGRIMSWSAGAERLYGYAASEMIGRITMAPAPAERREELAQLVRHVEGGGGVGRLETVGIRKSGKPVDVAVTVSPIKDAKGSIVGTSVITRDLTERRAAESALRRSEEQLRQAQKMEAVGRLAGGVAHDFNNILSVILSYTSLLREDLRAGDPLRADVVEIETAGKRAALLTQQLLAFSRQQVIQPRVIDLNAILADMTSMLRRLLGEDIDLTVLGPPDTGRILADPGQLEQVVMNLAVNARDAMQDGGKLTIETTNVSLDADYVGSHLGAKPGAYVMLALSDTGTGMDAATRARVFEPFFTTKEMGKGTGLGLSTVFGIVRQSGGYVDVYSEPGQGCAFKIYFPRTDEAADLTIAAPRAAIRGGAETVLLVEDEDQVRAVACAILRRNGYNVLEAANGGEAFLIAQEFGATIHLLLTDVVMPRMSGRKLTEHLASVRPEMRVLFASGYTDDAIVHHGVLNAGVAFLQKPFTPDALLRQVREVLDAPA